MISLPRSSARFNSRWHSRLLTLSGFAQGVAPALTGADVMEVEKDVLGQPTTGHQPLLEGKREEVILGRM